MKVLQFKTQADLDEWLNDHELFQCFDNDMNLIGEILGTDADVLVSFGIAEIDMSFNYCNIVKELTPKQLDELKKNRLVKTVVVDELMKYTPYQQAIIKRLRKDFLDARRNGLMALSNDDANRLYIINAKMFDNILTKEDLSGEWREIDGHQKFCHFSEDYLSEHIEIDIEKCESIEGNERIDFVSWGCMALPWVGHLKL